MLVWLRQKNMNKMSGTYSIIVLVILISRVLVALRMTLYLVETCSNL